MREIYFSRRKPALSGCVWLRLGRFESRWLRLMIVQTLRKS
jgi:hypothetical protein